MTAAEWKAANGDAPMPPGLVTPFVWIQPRTDAELLKRLAEARDYNVNERERENLCSAAHDRLKALLTEREL